MFWPQISARSSQSLIPKTTLMIMRCIYIAT
uniref:Uncharacterized protein n=1 Tax=Anguilla anguilla TaxID=7936 RepID=A0A0E9Y1L7_ANGAN